ncbi:MAG: OmpA family protein [Alphaproteobacteria bacterium]|nr:OmpA family protein [Alphaproteobacteria bacterium]
MLFALLAALASPAHAQDAGELVLIAVDPYGRPVEATWTLPDGETVSEGVSRTAVFVEPGRYQLAVTAEGFFGTSVEVDVLSGQRSEAQAMLDASLVTLTERAIVIHDKVHFETAKAVIKPESYDLLRQVARVIIEHPELTLISVEGHADSRGGEGYNLDLSTRRARAVYQFLIAQGVSPARLRSEGFGESRPILDEDTEEAWAKNRRVEFVIQERMDLPEAP